MTKILIQAIFLLLMSATFIGVGGFLGQVGLEKWREFRSYSNYNYHFFIGEPIAKSIEDPKNVKEFLNELDRGKRNADKCLTIAFSNPDQLERIREINDYTFRTFRDFWFIQSEWLSKNGRYFQGRKTMPDIPVWKRNDKVKLGFGLSDQVSDWNDIGYNEEYAPVQLECHVYEGPKGHGFTIWAKFKISNETWMAQMHIGPEENRSKNNFLWIASE